MSFDPKDFENNLPSRKSKKVSFNGLSTFINTLEKHFFSTISVHNNSSNDEQINLVIELNCDLTLMDMVIHSSKQAWGSFNHCKYSLAEEINLLEEVNDVFFDVDEFSINLKDTSIIIDKIYNKSISDQLDDIFLNLEKHYLHLSKGNVEVPYEIFVAVFEERIIPTNLSMMHNNKTHSYTSYWALYFESEKDAVIYDLDNAKFIYEDLYMLNE
ncbi:MAG: hypothetical protein WBM98_18560 [Maribacter sp.]|uniref:hypothetical protein n=1 Tax=Maribacter sp. TaxID=1897614 RepID=UPI003C73F485